MEIIKANGWRAVLKDELRKPYFEDLCNRIAREREAADVYPPSESTFAALELCDIDRVKVVLLGQDPYHGEGQANGLSFSVEKGVKLPPSLRNILKEVENETGRVSICADGDLRGWAEQGVLLLNSVLTVRAHEAGSHSGLGWERFTDAIIAKLSESREGLVFMLWGNYAAGKAPLIDENKHLVLKGAHPSPLSAYRGFFGCGHFTIANKYLNERGGESIKW